MKTLSAFYGTLLLLVILSASFPGVAHCDAPLTLHNQKLLYM